MPSTFSTNLKVELIAPGEQAGVWGDTTNTNFGVAFEEAITGISAVAYPSDANLTLTFADNNSTQQFRNLVLNVTGTISVTRELVVPTITKQYLIWNNTIGDQSIAVKTAAGSSVTVPNGAKMHLMVDGAGVVPAVTTLPAGATVDGAEVVSTTGTQTLTNKTLTSPVINTPTGDVATLTGTQTLTNKTLTSPVINTPTGDVATLTGTQTLTNKTLTSPVINTPTGVVASDIGYDNAISGLTATDVQAAIDEVGGRVDIFSERNKIINGKMEIAQRGTSFADVADGDYTLDRWVVGKSGPGAFTVIKNTADENPFKFNLNSVVTTSAAAPAAGDYVTIGQRVEGYEVYELIGRTFTLSFRVDGDAAPEGTYCVAFRNSGSDRSYVAEYEIDDLPGYKDISITVPGGLPNPGAGGTWNYASGVGLEITWVLRCGTTYQTTAGSWQTGNFLATVNQQDLFSGENLLMITGVQLEAGPAATPFEHRSYGEELALCQRYYLKTSGQTSGLVGVKYLNASASNAFNGAVTFPSIMRVAPTITFSATTATNCTNGTHVVSVEGATLRVDVTAAGQYRLFSDTIDFAAEL